jgi:AcrR family transcriptional regulator
MVAPLTELRDRASRYSGAQRRTVDVALELFARHGVGGTSLQMIADKLAVTKAAVYHQFHTKEAIALAVLETHLQPLEAALADAEAAGGTFRAREQLLGAVIDTVVENRHALSTLQNDPVLFRLLGEYTPARRLFARLFSVLLGDNLGEQARVRAAVLSAAIGAVAHPFVIDLDNATVRDELLKVARRLIFELEREELT